MRFLLHQCHPFGVGLSFFFTLAELFPGEETETGSLLLVSKVTEKVKRCCRMQNPFWGVDRKYIHWDYWHWGSIWKLQIRLQKGHLKAKYLYMNIDLHMLITSNSKLVTFYLSYIMEICSSWIHLCWKHFTAALYILLLHLVIHSCVLVVQFLFTCVQTLFMLYRCQILYWGQSWAQKKLLNVLLPPGGTMFTIILNIVRSNYSWWTQASFVFQQNGNLGQYLWY